MATGAAGQTAGPVELVTSPKDPYRHHKQKQGRVLGGQKEGGGVQQKWMEGQLTTLFILRLFP